MLRLLKEPMTHGHDFWQHQAFSQRAYYLDLRSGSSTRQVSKHAPATNNPTWRLLADARRPLRGSYRKGAESLRTGLMTPMPFASFYCLSKTTTSSYGVPLTLVPLLNNVMTLSSLETVRVIVPTALPAFFCVLLTVLLSIRVNARTS